MRTGFNPNVVVIDIRILNRWERSYEADRPIPDTCVDSLRRASGIAVVERNDSNIITVTFADDDVKPLEVCVTCAIQTHTHTFSINELVVENRTVSTPTPPLTLIKKVLNETLGYIGQIWRNWFGTLAPVKL